ncbi:MAG: ABC transporter permease subunit [Lachnospira sp.]
MQCKSCQAELPKKAKICPRCGTMNGKPKTNLKVLAVAGFVIMLVGSLLPFIQADKVIEINDVLEAYSFGFMNVSVPVMWYLFIALIVAGILFLVARKEIFAIVCGILAAVDTVVTFFGFDYVVTVGKNKYATAGYRTANVKLTDLLNNGYTASKETTSVIDHSTSVITETANYSVGIGLFVIAIGLVFVVAGSFIDIMKYFKKDLGVDAKYLSNSINQSISQKIYYYRGFYIMFLPVFIMIIIFNYLPMLGCRYAFTRYIVANPYYAGLYHFVAMFTNDTFFWSSFRNTLILSIIKLILNTGFAVIISLLLNEIVNMLFKKTVQTIVYLPHFMSWVVVYSVFKMLLSVNTTGVINGFLINIGLTNDPIPFLADSRYWRGTYYVMNIWKDTGWGTVLFLATLSGISPDLYEAAQIDGANRFKRLIYITFPALANTIITVFILNLAKVMNLYESVFVTMSDSVTDVAQVLQTYVYYKTFQGSGNSDYGYSTAVGLFKSFVGMILVLGCNWASKKVRGRGIV